MTIEQNWSEIKAFIKSTVASAKHFPITSLFTSATVDEHVVLPDEPTDSHPVWKRLPTADQDVADSSTRRSVPRGTKDAKAAITVTVRKSPAKGLTVPQEPAGMSEDEQSEKSECDDDAVEQDEEAPAHEALTAGDATSRTGPRHAGTEFRGATPAAGATTRRGDMDDTFTAPPSA